MTPGELLRTARKRSNRTAITLSHDLEISQAYLCDIERDRRDIPVHRIEQIATAYGVDVAQLFSLVVPIPAGYRLVKAEDR